MECTIHLTDGCNLNCKYCYEGNRKHPNMITEDILRQALKYVIENNPERDLISLTFLGGEPLLNKKMLLKAVDIIDEEYQEYKPLIKYYMTTNGVFLDENTINFLEKNKFILSISIDGDKETHNINRISNNHADVYETIIKNMKLMMDHKMKFYVRMTVTGNNVEYMFKNVKYFFDLGVKHIHLGIDSKYGWNKDELDTFDEQLTLLEDYYLTDVVKDEDKIINIFDYKLTTFIAKREPMFCSGGTKGHLIINSHGDIFPCGYVSNNEIWNLGNVKNGLDSNKFLNIVRKNVGKNSKCSECEIAFTCNGTKCGYLNYIQTEFLNIPSESLCNEQKMLYKHNFNVVKSLYEMRHPRIMKYLDLAKNYEIEISSIMRKIINS